MDQLIRQLDVRADPRPSFVDATLGTLLPRVDAARRSDAGAFGLLRGRLPAALGGPDPLSRRDDAVAVGPVARVAVALLLVLLAIVGAVYVGGRLAREPIPVTQLESPRTEYAGIFERVEGLGVYSTGVMLEDGRVLLGSGATDASLHAWDPATGTVERSGALATPRSRPTLVRLRDGRVLVLGGDMGAPDAEGRGTIAASTAEVFDPRTSSSVAAGPMVMPRRWAYATALLPDGRVLIAGGSDLTTIDFPDLDGRVATAELFDPATGTFSAVEPMAMPRADHAMVALPDGRVLVAGGTADWSATPEIFDPTTGTFSLLGPMSGPDDEFAAAVPLSDGRVLVIDSACDRPADDPAGHHPATTAFFDPVTGAFAPGPSIPDCVGSATLLPNGEVLLLGHWWDGDGQWQPGIGTTREAPRGIERAFGWSGLLDPFSGDVRATESIARAGAQRVVLPDGRVVLLGGAVLDDSGLANLYS